MDKGFIAVLVLVIAFFVGLGALMSWAIEVDWNTVVPSYLHGPSIDYNEACALWCLFSLAVSSIHQRRKKAARRRRKL